jgi:hypothetical protein
LTDQSTETEQNPDVCAELVVMLQNMLDQARTGKLKGAVVLMVQGPGIMGPRIAPTSQWMLEYYAAAGMLKSRIEMGWHAQIMDQMQQAQQQAAQHRRGIARATEADLKSLKGLA